MNNLNKERLERVLSGLKQSEQNATGAFEIGEDTICDAVAAISELLALREAGKEPVYQYQIDGAWHDCDYEFYSGCHEKYRRVTYAAPQLPAVPEGAEQRFAAAVELLKQAAPHMLADESLKDPDGALCGKMRAEPELVTVPDEFLSAEQNQRGMFELSEDCMVRLASALAQQSKGLVVPPGWAAVPRRITAENGAKGALMGEFLESKYISCTECFGDDDCESCDGSGRVKVDVTVSWDTIKRIYSSSVELFCKEGAAIAAAPKPEVK